MSKEATKIRVPAAEPVLSSLRAETLLSIAATILMVVLYVPLRGILLGSFQLKGKGEMKASLLVGRVTAAAPARALAEA